MLVWAVAKHIWSKIANRELTQGLKWKGICMVSLEQGKKQRHCCKCETFWMHWLQCWAEIGVEVWKLWHAWGTIRVASLALCWGAYPQNGLNLKFLLSTTCHHTIWGLTIHAQIRAWATNSRTTGKPLAVLAAIMTPDVSSDQSWNQWWVGSKTTRRSKAIPLYLLVRDKQLCCLSSWCFALHFMEQSAHSYKVRLALTDCSIKSWTCKFVPAQCLVMLEGNCCSLHCTGRFICDNNLGKLQCNFLWQEQYLVKLQWCWNVTVCGTCNFWVNFGK